MKSVFALLLACAGPLSAAVSLPYSNNFGSSVADFTTGGANSTWTLGGGTYTNSITADGPSFAMVQATGLGAGTKQSFSVSTTLTSFSASSGSVGFGLLATAANLGTASFLLADMFNDGTLRFRPFTNGGATGSDVSLTTLIRPLQTSTLGAVTLSVTGVYNPDNSLTLTLTAVQGATTANHSTTYAAAGLVDGTWFGYRDRNNTGVTTVVTSTAVLDNFSLQAIPEPSAILASAMSLGFACIRRNRR